VVKEASNKIHYWTSKSVMTAFYVLDSRFEEFWMAYEGIYSI